MEKNTIKINLSSKGKKFSRRLSYRKFPVQVRKAFNYLEDIFKFLKDKNNITVLPDEGYITILLKPTSQAEIELIEVETENEVEVAEEVKKLKKENEELKVLKEKMESMEYLMEAVPQKIMRMELKESEGENGR